MGTKTALTVALAVLLAVGSAGSALADEVTTVTVSEDGAGDWHLNRDPANTAPYAFTADQASIGTGSLHVGPIATDPSSKFIAELFDTGQASGTPVAGLTSIAYDFRIEDGTAADADRFYLNVYVNLPGSTTFYDCRYDYVPSTGAVGAWTTASFAADATPTNVRARGGATCAGTLAGSPDGSTVNFLSLNVGDSGAGDAGLSGYLDHVRVARTDATTVYDFEPVPPSPQSKDDCKDGGYADFGFSNQGRCIASVQANEHAGR